MKGNRQGQHGDIPAVSSLGRPPTGPRALTRHPLTGRNRVKGRRMFEKMKEGSWRSMRSIGTRVEAVRQTRHAVNGKETQQRSFDTQH